MTWSALKTIRTILKSDLCATGVSCKDSKTQAAGFRVNCYSEDLSYLLTKGHIVGPCTSSSLPNERLDVVSVELKTSLWDRVLIVQQQFDKFHFKALLLLDWQSLWPHIWCVVCSGVCVSGTARPHPTDNPTSHSLRACVLYWNCEYVHIVVIVSAAASCPLPHLCSVSSCTCDSVVPEAGYSGIY